MTSVNHPVPSAGPEAKCPLFHCLCLPLDRHGFSHARSLVSYNFVTNTRLHSYSLTAVFTNEFLAPLSACSTQQRQKQRVAAWRLTTPRRFSLPCDRPFAMIPEACESQVFVILRSSPVQFWQLHLQNGHASVFASEVTDRPLRLLEPLQHACAGLEILIANYARLLAIPLSNERRCCIDRNRH